MVANDMVSRRQWELNSNTSGFGQFPQKCHTIWSLQSHLQRSDGCNTHCDKACCMKSFSIGQSRTWSGPSGKETQGKLSSPEQTQRCLPSVYNLMWEFCPDDLIWLVIKWGLIWGPWKDNGAFDLRLVQQSVIVLHVSQHQHLNSMTNAN